MSETIWRATRDFNEIKNVLSGPDGLICEGWRIDRYRQVIKIQDEYCCKYVWKDDGEDVTLEYARLWRIEIPQTETKRDDKIIQVSGFGVENNHITQCNYMLCALTESGQVLLSRGDGEWTNVTQKGLE